MNKISKTQYILNTIDLLKNEFKNEPEFVISFNKMKDTVAHSAPEIVSRRWNKIYFFCVTYCRDNKNPAHLNAYKIYHDRIKEYSKIYID